MRIKSFQLLNHKIKVRYKKRIICPDGSSPYGVTYVEKNLIEIATHSPSSGEHLPEDFIEHTTYHELGHFMMALMGRNELFSDENFVDLFGSLLAQFLKTRK